MKTAAAALILWLVAGLSGCSIADRRAGIPNRWHDEARRFQRGKTTEQEVLDALGPPSHVLEINDRTAYYYLLEDDHTWAVTAVVFNYSNIKAKFDRAIFFFDADRKLAEFAVSRRRLPEGDDEE